MVARTQQLQKSITIARMAELMSPMDNDDNVPEVSSGVLYMILRLLERNSKYCLSIHGFHCQIFRDVLKFFKLQITLLKIGVNFTMRDPFCRTIL